MTNDERITNLSATVRTLADLCAKLQEENSLDNLDNECETLRGELQRIRTERDQLKRENEDLETEVDFLRLELKEVKANEH